MAIALRPFLTMLAAGAAAFSGHAARAAAFAGSFSFSAVVFGDQPNLFTGTFALSETAQGFVLTDFDAAYRGTRYDLSNTSLQAVRADRIIIGGNENGGPGSISTGSDDFRIFLNPLAGAFVRGDIVAPTTDINDLDLTLTPSGTSAVPEPATWITMILGFALIGGMTRLRRAGRRDLAHPA
ncbi:hypothetical protein FHY05_002217 [Sphingomonas sp. BK580]|nr:PEPxxWA-CTERM sorting domain-containing protein [Sphingomonas sp. BK580]MBB3693578.1 hypothetical protein [Sphingomonas sp. BK580]